MKVFTSRINYAGPNRLDITAKSGTPTGKVFAPTWKMIMDYKQTGDKEAYTAAYYEMMRKSYVEHRAIWDRLLAMEEIVFVCYCKAGDFCHRVILAEIFTQLGATYGGEV